MLASAQVPREDRINQLRNLGKAFYENPATPIQAAATFKQAWDLNKTSQREKLNYALATLRTGKTAEAVRLLREVQTAAPQIPHTWFNLGIEYKKAGNTAEARAQFERLIQLAPDEAKAHYQLGALDAQEGRVEEAIARFELAARLDPTLGAAQFQLYNLSRAAGRDQQSAATALTKFQELRAAAQGSVTPEDVDWSRFSEVYDEPAPAAATAQFVPGRERTLPFPGATGIAILDLNRLGRVDLLVWSPEAVRVFRNNVALPRTGLEGVAGAKHVATGDFNNDGWMDLCIITASGPKLYRNRSGRFVADPSINSTGQFSAAVWIDYDHDYDLDLLLFGAQPTLYRNQGTAGFREMPNAFPFVAGDVNSVRKLRLAPDTKVFDLIAHQSNGRATLYRDKLGGHYEAEAWTQPPEAPDVMGDFNSDGFNDQASIADGGIRVTYGRVQANTRWVRIQLRGERSLRLAQDAEVEVKASSFYARATYTGVPLTFAVGRRATIDAIRITWPNGLIQNETRQPTNRAYVYREAQRLSGSCPMIWTWNGREFEFITDVLGVAPLGASDGEGSFFPVDHDEYIVIPGRAMKSKKGKYELRITEELAEVTYLDQVQLTAVDHPAGTVLVTNEKFKAPPYAEARLFTPRKRYPAGATDDRGTNVLALITSQDRRYPANFERNMRGIATEHYLELDFTAAPQQAMLFLNGWVDWPDGSTFRAAAQESARGLLTPRLEALDASGQWQTLDADMGMPAGKPKTIAVPVRFPSHHRRLRVVTNIPIYWDEVWIDASAPELRESPLKLLSADLHYRGFSPATIDPQRLQPDTYHYAPVKPTSYWNPTPGNYTRFGTVDALLNDVDDRLVLFGSGDEVTLHFEALSPPPAGWVRDFVLKVDGWAKDSDPNTAHSASVESLPFQAMSQYPYSTTEHFPDDASHRAYREAFNTRPALRLIRPLEPR